MIKVYKKIMEIKNIKLSCFSKYISYFLMRIIFFCLISTLFYDYERFPALCWDWTLYNLMSESEGQKRPEFVNGVRVKAPEDYDFNTWGIAIIRKERALVNTRMTSS